LQTSLIITFIYFLGFSGEIIIKNLDSEFSPATLKNYSTDPNCITNHISPIKTDPKLLISCNDASLRIMDLNTGRIKSIARFPYAVNASEASNDDRMVACVCDSRKVRILDIKSSVEIASIQGHFDHCFSVSWSPCGRYLASGSQDRSARIFDIRKLDQSLHTLVGVMAPIRSVKFSPCGSLFTMMEADDFVHIFNTKSDFKESQVIDFFGEISGITFDPDGHNFYIGCAGNENGGIFEFNHPNSSV
jgi:WD40 repeat protein